MTSTADTLTNTTATLSTPVAPTQATSSASGQGSISTMEYAGNLRVPAVYTLGMVAATLDNFSGRDVVRYLEKLEQRAKLDNWTEVETLNLLKFKCVGAAYEFLKSDTSLDELDYRALKAKLIGNFAPTVLPGENQLNLSRCYQRHDETVSSYCTRLRNLGARVLAEDVRNATVEEVPGLKKKSQHLILNQFKMSLKKEIIREVGVILLREENLTLDKAEELVKLYEVNTRMTHGKNPSHHQALQVSCYSCGKAGHIAKDCWSGRRNEPRHGQGNNVCFSCNERGHWAKDCPRRNKGGNNMSRDSPRNMPWGRHETPMRNTGRNLEADYRRPDRNSYDADRQRERRTQGVYQGPQRNGPEQGTSWGRAGPTREENKNNSQPRIEENVRTIRSAYREEPRGQRENVDSLN